MITLLVLNLLLQQDSTSQLRSVIGTPTGRNGYEEYINAAIELQKPEFEDAYRLVLKSPPGADTFLSSRIKAANVGLKAKSMILAGNAKPVARPGIADLKTVFPEMAYLRMVSRYFAVLVCKEFSEGRYVEAGDSILASLVYSQNVSHAGVVLNYLVGTAGLGNVLQSIDEYLNLVPLSTWKKIVKYCDDALATKEFVDVIKRELAISRVSVEQFFNQPDLVMSMEDMSQEDKDLLDRVKALTPQQKQLMVQSVRASMDSALTKLQDVFSKNESGWPEGMAMIENDRWQHKDPLAYFLSSVLEPSFSNVAIMAVRNRAQLRVLRLHGLIQSYRWERGVLPKSLKDLPRQDAVTDPLGNGEFQYTLQGDTYDLFSKGHSATGPIGLVYKRPAGKGEDVMPPEQSPSYLANGLGTP